MKTMLRKWLWSACAVVSMVVVGCSWGVTPESPHSSSVLSKGSESQTQPPATTPPAKTPQQARRVETKVLPVLPPQADLSVKKLAKPMKQTTITSHKLKVVNPTLPRGSIKDKPIIEGLVAHEWGTYTSVSSSDGREMEGLHHEEEKLPSFVLHRGQYVKGMEAVPMGVTQKLETPVIYFYTKKATTVNVKVDFPQGIISEWFPRAASFKPSINYNAYLPPSFLQKGSMTWKVKVDPAITQAPPHVEPDNVWAPSRQVTATPLKETTSNKTEKFIFYRGLGRFSVPFRAQARSNGQITLINQSKQSIPAVFILHVTEKGAAFAAVGGVEAHSKKLTITPSNLQPFASYIDNATGALAKALQKHGGLYKDEAWAMVNTWRHSYFKSPSPGLRILYIAPRAWTDALLPLTITPKPTEVERVLVGRVELLTPNTEKDTILRLTAAYEKGLTLNVGLFGRFAEPKLRRALEQLTDPKLKAYTQQFVDALSRMRYR